MTAHGEPTTDDTTKRLHVRLADAPTDVLVHLVDHGPCARGQIEQAVAPADAVATVATVAAALSLLSQLGWAELHNVSLAYLWSATTEGREAVAKARAAVTL